jgi:hypothetical protein
MVNTVGRPNISDRRAPYASNLPCASILEELMRTTATLLAVSCAVLVIAAPVVAHHAFQSEFDNTQPLLLEGEFVGMDWVNPHSWVHFEVTFPDGRKEVWSGETGPINQLMRGGWARDTIQIGDTIQVNGAAAKNGSQRMWASQVRILARSGEVLEEPIRVLDMFGGNPAGDPEGLPPLDD